MAASRILTAWLPVALWAALIFALSSIPGLGTGLGAWDVILRKAAHMTEFAIFGALVYRALPRALPTIVFGVLYAVTDELHQHLVPDRHGSPLDVALDAVGVVAGVLLYRKASR